MLLGGFALERGRAPVPLPLACQRLVTLLALRGRPLQRSFVAGTLWGGSSEEKAQAALRTSLWRTHRAASALVEATPSALALAADVRTDLTELVELAERVLRTRSLPAGVEVEALVHAQPLLPDWYEDWVSDEREHVRQLRLLALEHLGTELLAAGRTEEAVVVALAAVTTDPLRESACRLLMRSHVRAGNVADALARYLSYRVQLADRLGLVPSREMEDLVADLTATAAAAAGRSRGAAPAPGDGQPSGS